MSTKILIDSIYSARPSHCASAVKMWRFVDYVLNTQGRTDVFFYWLIPEWLEEEDLAFYPEHDNVVYLQFPYHRGDRTRAYLAFPAELDRLLAFNGVAWDFDIVMTNRTTQVPLMKMVMSSPREPTKTWMKNVFLFEEMPLMAFKSTVAISNVPVTERMTIAGHLAADRTAITISHERDGLISGAKRYVPPSSVMELRDKIKVTSPSLLEDFEEKDKKYRFTKGEEKFCLAFVGRVSATDHIREVYDTMVKHWITKGDDRIKLIVSTVTPVYKIEPPEMVEYINLPRDEFWEALKTEMHCIMYLAEEAGFGMSLMEPLMFGVPVVLIRAPWSEALVGKDYPLFIDTESKAYGMVKAIHDDYEEYYRQFIQWQHDVLQPMFQEGGQYSQSFYDYMYKGLLEFEEMLPARYAAEQASKQNNNIVQALLDGDPEEFVLFDRIRELGKKGDLKSLQSKTREGDRDRRGLVWSTPWNDIRIALKTFFGYEDASVTVGHLRKVK